MSKYKSEWKAGSDNHDFWNEVLVGKKITVLHHKDGRLDSFILDSGEEVFIVGNENGIATLSIKD